jgi:hypothetical protein
MIRFVKAHHEQNVRSMLISSVLVLSLACLISGCEKAGPVELLEGTATVTVTVKDQAGQLLSNVTVELYSDGVLQSSNRLDTKSTNVNGQAIFPNILTKVGTTRLWGIRVTSSSANLTCSNDTVVGCSCQQLQVPIQFTSDKCVQTNNPVCSRNVDNLTFGRVLVGTSRDTSFLITNRGTAPLIINSISVVPPGNVFLVTSPISFPDTLNPGQSVTVRVRFAPQGAETYSARLVISTNATGQNSCGDVMLQGEGTVSATIRPASLMRWDQIKYFGWGFIDDPNITGALVADSVRNRTNPAPNATFPSQDGKLQQADFIYFGLKSATDTSQGGYILAANGAQVLTTNANPDYRTFDDTHAHVPTSGYQSETAIPVKRNDVIAIKTREGRYAKIRITAFFAGNGGVKEEIQFEQIFPAIAP